VLSLPMGPDLATADQDRVIDAVAAACGLEGDSPLRLGRPHPGENPGFSRGKAA
jgi:hypothetical protein